MNDEEKVDRAWLTTTPQNVKVTSFPSMRGGEDDVAVQPVRLPRYRASVTFENAETGEVLMSTTMSGSARFVAQVAASAGDAFVDVLEC